LRQDLEEDVAAVGRAVARLGSALLPGGDVAGVPATRPVSTQRTARLRSGRKLWQASAAGDERARAFPPSPQHSFQLDLDGNI